MAPEQASDARTAGIHSDIFSLGRTLYYLLTNERPADSLESDGSWELIVTGVWDPAPVQRFRPDVPTGLVNLIYKMTARKLRDRYQTCDQVAKSLEYWCTAWPCHCSRRATRMKVRRGITVPPTWAGCRTVCSAVLLWHGLPPVPSPADRRFP